MYPPSTLVTRIANESSSIPPDIAKITAPILFGPLVGWALYGALCVQIYVYTYNFPDDKRTIKSLAYFTFALETVQTILVGADVYFWFIEGFGNIERLKDSHYAPIDIPIFESIISFIVQEFFCYRIWTLSRSRGSSWFCIFIAIIAVVQSIGAAWGGIESLVAGKYAVSKIALYLWSIPSAIADILIAVAMTWLLRRKHSNGGRYSDHILIRLVHLTIETNALSASVAIASFVLYVAYPDEIYYTFTSGIIGKIYSNTLLVSLNNRIYFREHPRAGIHMESDESGRSHRSTAITSLHFAQVGQPTQSNTLGDSDSFGLETLSHTNDTKRKKGDDLA